MLQVARLRGSFTTTRYFMGFLVLLYLGLTPTQAATDDATGEANAVWKAFRKAQYFHSDVIGITAPNAVGERVLIIAEPPERLTLAQIRKVLTPFAKAVQTFSHEVMHGGIVTDVVATLKPGLNADRLEVLNAELHEALLGTVRSARLLQLPIDSPRMAGKSLDLKVTADELQQYLFDDSSKLISNALDKPLTLRTVLARKLRGVYRSTTEPGFAIWVLPRGGDISNLADQSREFAFAGDTILGAVANKDTVVIIARLRQQPLQRLPPLRNDTLQLLAAVNAKNISQSYERTMWPSGRSPDSFDRAPIYLSSELRDTEYGSLLNIVDQLLKGWSEAGQVVYKDFHYEKPASFPFGTARASSTAPNSADGFLFNWNTDGIFYTLAGDGVEIVALNRTGSLPVIYGSRQKRRLTTEATGYDYFAKSGDANIARVVQYATVFAVFKRYGINSNWLGAEPLPQDATIPVLVRASEAAVQLLLAAHSDPENWGRAKEDISRSPSLAALMPEVEKALTELAAMAPEQRSKRIDTYSRLLGDPRGDRQRLAEKTYNTLKSQSSSQEERARATRAEEQLKEVSAIENLLSNSQLGSTLANKIGLWNYMEKLAEKQSNGWIQTAAVVASKDEANRNAVGGHSIDSSMVSLKADASLAKGEIIAGMDRSGEVTILYSPSDRSKVALLSRKISELDGKPINEVEAALGKVVRETVYVKRTIKEALVPNDLTLAEMAEYRVAFTNENVKAQSARYLPSPAEKVISGQYRPTVFVRRTDDHYEVFSTETDSVLSIGSSAALRQVLVDQARAGSFQAGQARIVLSGFEGKAGPMIESIKARMSRFGKIDAESDAILISTDGRFPEYLVSKQQWSKAEIDVAAITIKVISTGRMAGATEMTIPVKLPPIAAGKPSIFVRFVLYFKGTLDAVATNRVIAKVLQAFKDLSFTEISLLDSKARLKVILAKDGIDVLDLEVRGEAADVNIADSDNVLATNVTS